MKRMEAILAASDCDWTVFRPPQLTDRPATGKYRARPPRRHRLELTAARST